MALDLTSVRNQIETRLQDSTNLIYATATIDEAIRAALLDLSTAYGEILSLDGLDLETETTFEDQDLNVLLVGGVAYCLRYRFIGIYEEATPEQARPNDLAKWATDEMHHFLSLLTLVRLRRFQETDQEPYSEWEWDEEDRFV